MKSGYTYIVVVMCTVVYNVQLVFGCHCDRSFNVYLVIKVAHTQSFKCSLVVFWRHFTHISGA